MAQEPLGQMVNAPLALVLAQVRFSAYLTIGAHIPAIQDALRKAYPAFRKNRIQSLEIGPGGGAPNISTVEQWHLADVANQEAIILQQDSLTVIATRYKTYADFASRHLKVLECFEHNVPDVLVERLGLRYVDIIVPKENERPEDYVVEGLRGCQPDALSPLRGFRSQYVARWNLDNGALVFKFISGATAPFLPPDLEPLELETPEILYRASTTKSPVGILDFDRIMEHRATFQASEVARLFSGMHDDASSAFKHARSGLAESIWNSKTER